MLRLGIHSTNGEFDDWLTVTSPEEAQLVTRNVSPQLPDQLLLSLSLSLIFEIAGSDVLSGLPVRLADVVFDVLAANAPQAPPTDLKSTQLPHLD
jgi:hypothetical protein